MLLGFASWAPSWDDEIVGPGDWMLVAVLAGTGIVLLTVGLRVGFFDNPSIRLPRHLVFEASRLELLPDQAKKHVYRVSEKLERRGFELGNKFWSLPAFSNNRQRVYLVPLIHKDEAALFVVTVAVGWTPDGEQMLHILSAIEGGQRVETSTLVALDDLKAPDGVRFRRIKPVEDVASVEELWSQHRRALTDYQRDERVEVDLESWRDLFHTAYSGWLNSAVRAQRVRLTKNDRWYRIRHRWEWS